MGVNFIWGNFPVSDANEAERFAGALAKAARIGLRSVAEYRPVCGGAGRVAVRTMVS